MKIKRAAIHSLFGIFIAVALAGFAWGADCGDTAGPGGTNVPCACGDTVVTTTTLTSPTVDPVNGDPVVSTADTDVCAGDGLVIAPPNASRINLSLGDNAVAGSGGGVGIKVVGVGVRVTIRNGRVRGFQTGIGTAPGSSTDIARINKIVFTRNIDAINLTGNSNEVTENQATDNTGTGMLLTGNRSLVFGNQVGRNSNHGIVIIGNENQLDTNGVNRNIGNGIYVSGNNNWLDHNTSENNSLDGIAVVGNGDGDSATLELWKNKVTKNGGSGISIDGDRHDIVANQANQNRADGISVDGTGNHLDTNIARENKLDGIFAAGGANVDQGGNLGKKNGGVQCQIDGAACKP